MKPRIRKRNNEWAINIDASMACNIKQISVAYRLCEYLNRSERKLTLVA